MLEIIKHGSIACTQCSLAVAAYYAGVGAGSFWLCFILLCCSIMLIACGFFNLLKTGDAIEAWADACASVMLTEKEHQEFVESVMADIKEKTR